MTTPDDYPKMTTPRWQSPDDNPQMTTPDDYPKMTTPRWQSPDDNPQMTTPDVYPKMTTPTWQSPDVVIWGLSSGVVIWGCHLGLSSGVVIWGCHLLLSSRLSSELSSRLSSGVVIWDDTLPILVIYWQLYSLMVRSEFRTKILNFQIVK
jgi:hypothetical protein